MHLEDGHRLEGEVTPAAALNPKKNRPHPVRVRPISPAEAGHAAAGLTGSASGASGRPFTHAVCHLLTMLASPTT
jgi:hypothetical protein